MIRAYHEPDNRVIDHRLPNRQWTYKDVVHGDGFVEIIVEEIL
jgi:protein subunit release factor A